jgi:RHS repeat-associated protein
MFSETDSTRNRNNVVRRRLLIALAIAWVVVYASSTALAQSQDGYLNGIGIPTYQSGVPVENGYVSVNNGVLHLEIPLGSFPQRGGREFKAALVYDSNIWGGGGPVNIPAANFDGLSGAFSLSGWRLVTSGDKGYVDFVEQDVNTCTHQGVHEIGYMWYQSWTWTAPDGATHGFGMRTRQGSPNDCGNMQQWNQPNGSGFALDSSGYSIYSDSNYNITVRAPDGTLVYPKVEDSNGNIYVSTLLDSRFGTAWYQGVFPTSGTVTDSLGRTLLTASLSGTTVYIDVANSKGTTGRYTITTAQIPTYAGQMTPVIQSVQLPDSTSYSFLYDCYNGTGNSACGTQVLSSFDGEITSMTMPSGGQIQYSYHVNTVNSQYVNTSISSRTTPDSANPWNYALSWDPTTCPGVNNTFVPMNCLQSLTVSKPSGDTAVYTVLGEDFGGAWPTQAQYYSGAVSPSNLLATINQTFNFSFPCTDNGIQACGTGPIYVTKTSQASTLPVPSSSSVSQTTKFTWDGANTSPSLYGNLMQKQDWNFGTSLSGNPDRTTAYTYWSDSQPAYLTANILNRVASTTVTNNSGGTVTQTVNCYDYANGCGGASFTNAGTITNHDTNYGTSYTVRGDLTQTQKLVSGSTYLTQSMSYDTAGQVLSKTDWTNLSTHTTTYSYTDQFYTDAGNGSNPSTYSAGTATDGYPTTITYPTVNSVTPSNKFGYYYGTGQKALSTDPNNQTTYFHYYDPLDRPTATSLPNLGWTRTTYNSTEIDNYTGVTSSTPTTSCAGTTGGCRRDENMLDGLARVSSKILVSDPDGPTTVGTAYDSNGRTYSVSNPHRSGSLPTDGTELYPTYDGLDRKIQITKADGGVENTYYGMQVSNYGGLSSQKCASSYGYGYPVLTKDEARNLRQSWTDGFGRMIEVDEPNTSGSLSSGVGTCYAYDLNNNLIGVLQPGSETTCTLNSVAYNRCFTYDLSSRLTAATNPESGTISYIYDQNTSCPTPNSFPGQLVSKTDARGIRTCMQYDALNRLTLKNYNDSGPTTPTVQYGYDAFAPSGCTLPTLTITNGKGRRTGMCDGSGATAWSYDSVGNAAAEARTISSVSPSVTKTVSVLYNYDSSVAQITYPSTRVLTYGTSNAQRQTTATDTTTTSHINYALGPSGCPNGQNWACYAPQGALSLLQNGASLITTSYYNNRLEPCRFAVNAGTIAPTSCTDSGHSGDKFDIQYSFDLSLVNTPCLTNFGSPTNNGYVAAIFNNVNSMSGRSQNFCYDSLNRIKQAETTSTYSTSAQFCWAESYTIDPISNLTAITPITGNYNGCSQESGFNFNANINAHNQFTTSGFSYDSAGNLTASPSMGGLSMAYDAESRIRTTAGVTYTYDGDGNRVEKSGSTLYWYGSSGQVLTETSTTGSSPLDYAFFAGRRIARVDASNNVYYYFADQLGSSRVQVQDGSTPTLCYDGDFYPYGGERAYTTSCTQHYKFTAKERDSESNLDDFGARYYSSQYGRFVSPDWSANVTAVPYADFVDPQTLNLYGYVRNNPLAKADIDGHCPWCVAAAVWVGEYLGIKAGQNYYDGKITGALLNTIRTEGDTLFFAMEHPNDPCCSQYDLNSAANQLLSDYAKALPMSVQLGSDILGYVDLARSIVGVQSPGGSMEKAIGEGGSTGVDTVKRTIQQLTEAGAQSQKQPISSPASGAQMSPSLPTPPTPQPNPQPNPQPDPQPNPQPYQPTPIPCEISDKRCG